MADEGVFTVTRDGELVADMHPQKRRYANGQVMTEAALEPGLMYDLYVSLGEPLDEQGNAWAVSLYYKFVVRFIWLGALFMMAGGFLAASDPRYRRERAKARERADDAQTAETPA
jgi:cytochrome c-type biogenesis protein CcmF